MVQPYLEQYSQSACFCYFVWCFVIVIWFTAGLTNWYFGFHIVHNYYLYADDTQLFISLDPDNLFNISPSSTNLEHCIADIQQEILKLNDDKTNII